MTFARTLAVTIVAAAALTLAVRAQVPAGERFNERLLQAFTYRNIGPFRMQARIADDRGAGLAGEGSSLHVLRRALDRRPLEDDEQRHDVRAACSTARHARRSAPSRSRRRTRTSSGSAPATRSRRAARTPATASTSPLDAGKTWTNMGLTDSHHIARIAIHPTEPGHRLRRGDGPSVLRRTPSAACSRRRTAARRGRRCCTSDESVGVIDLRDEPDATRRCSTRRRTTSSDCRGRS